MKRLPPAPETYYKNGGATPYPTDEADPPWPLRMARISLAGHAYHLAEGHCGGKNATITVQFEYGNQVITHNGKQYGCCWGCMGNWLSARLAAENTGNPVRYRTGLARLRPVLAEEVDEEDK